MELYTLDRGFVKQETIDKFKSAIWTERYYGDGDFELSVPATNQMISTLTKGQLMLCEDSDIPMILEHREIKEGVLKTTGISVLKWLNNRIFRTSADHSVREFIFSSDKPGEILSWIVQNFCISGSYLNGGIPIGIGATDRDRFDIPGLVIGTTDLGGSDVELSVPFGNIYDILNQIATTYEVGMNIKLDYADELSYQISFNNYRGADRTSAQSVNPVIQFSAEMDSFTNVTDLESVSDYKNLIFTFATNAEAADIDEAGSSSSVPNTTDGFDLRVDQEFISDIDIRPDDIPLPESTILNLLNQKAAQLISERKEVWLVDGEIVDSEQIKYGVNFFLGDIIEVTGNTGVLQQARITEYIRSQDEAGEREYPTLSMID